MKLFHTLKLALERKQLNQLYGNNHRTVAGTKRARQMMSQQDNTRGVIIPKQKDETK